MARDASDYTSTDTGMHAHAHGPLEEAVEEGNGHVHRGAAHLELLANRGHPPHQPPPPAGERDEGTRLGAARRVVVAAVLLLVAPHLAKHLHRPVARQLVDRRRADPDYGHRLLGGVRDRWWRRPRNQHGPCRGPRIRCCCPRRGASSIVAGKAGAGAGMGRLHVHGARGGGRGKGGRRLAAAHLLLVAARWWGRWWRPRGRRHAADAALEELHERLADLGDAARRRGGGGGGAAAAAAAVGARRGAGAGRGERGGGGGGGGRRQRVALFQVLQRRGPPLRRTTPRRRSSTAARALPFGAKRRAG